jgi:hypothetical protein
MGTPKYQWYLFIEFLQLDGTRDNSAQVKGTLNYAVQNTY